MRVIPAIDLKGGRCVRLLKGDFERVTEYEVTPLDLASRYAALGADWIHCVDLDGARDGGAGNLHLLGALAEALPGRIQAGGGIRALDQARGLLALGAGRVVAGSVAAEDPGAACEWLAALGPERLVLALDVAWPEGSEPVLRSRGWTRDTGRVLWDALARYAAAGLAHVLCTEVSRDGAMTGPALALYERCVRRFPGIAFQASGGVRDAADLGALAATGVASAIVGRALLEGRITDEELQPFLPAV